MGGRRRMSGRRRVGGRHRAAGLRAAWRTLAAASGAGLLAAALLILATPAMARLAARLAAAAQTVGMRADTARAARDAGPAGTSPAVGALFRISPGRGGQPLLGRPFCTATVVDSRSGDLLLTAAHCVADRTVGQFAFVPEYRDGQAPAGVWPVTKVFVDQTWSATASPADDVAFLLVQRAATARAGRYGTGRYGTGRYGTGRYGTVQSRTGADRLGTGQPAGQLVQVTGYPNRASAPVTCWNRAEAFGPAELRFDCPGFAPGTSGSALLGDVNPVTGLGTVVGVIGGYQQGGDTSSVSYADRITGEVAGLYGIATARS